MSLKKSHGLTLIETLSTISIIAILASVAVPSMISTIKKNKKSALRDELISALSLTRTTAVTSGTSATICGRAGSSEQCSYSASGWRDGWVIFIDKDNDGAIDASEKIVNIKNNMPSGVLLQTSTSRITYDSQGVADGYQTTFEFCSSGSDNDDYAIYVSNFGYMREASSGDELAGCP